MPSQSKLRPSPNPDQFVPSHFAILVAATPPAERKSPPTYRLVPMKAMARATGEPAMPMLDQSLPFHLAMFVAGLAPACVKPPTTIRSVPETINEETPPFSPAP